MITKTNFQMLKELLKDFTPETPGILSEQEVLKIKTTLCIPEMDVLSLRNLRDFTVMFLSNKSKATPDDYGAHDMMSGITHVIDLEIFNKGGEV